MSSVSTKDMSSVSTKDMSSVATKDMSFVETEDMSSVETEDMSELFKWLFARRPAAGGINLMFAVRSRLRGADYL